ncbi:OLC1v1029319C1 [Oldenlandia corymbosa var. corymbosa]|uniref:OLC1v1029319C1 n=1 Tax=Oldenlandia corymbosa var. corymbosa TaxID=529605 RepID=A0AAV1CFG2_OLDCO|nr:OLC1v1029319C1 [Oldenlandia corymbosa var. corymbosa]
MGKINAGKGIQKTKLEELVYDAAVENNVTMLRQLLEEDSLILDKATLHSQDKSPLHIAAMLGNVEFVNEVIRASPDLCLAGDRHGRLPLHLAAIKGRFSVLQELVHALPLSAQERIHGGGNVLHLCIKYNQFEALKFLVQTIQDDDFSNQKDDAGMTILHLAVSNKQTKTIRYLVENKVVQVNVKNENGKTPSDLLKGENNNSEVAKILHCAGAKRGKEIGSCEATGSDWLRRKRESIMVVASLIATMAFQAGLNPAGGVWQDDNLDGPNPHVAGTAVMAQKQPRYHEYFLRTNSVAFVSSLSTILFLISGLPFRNKFFCWALMVTMWLTITAIALTYGISIVIVTPHDSKKQLSRVIKTSLMVWCGVMFFLLVGNTFRLMNRWLWRRHGIDLFKNLRRYESLKSRAQVRSNCGEDDCSV